VSKLSQEVSFVRLHMVIESSSNDSVEGEIESQDDDVVIVDEEHELHELC